MLRIITLTLSLITSFSVSAIGQDKFEKVEITTIKVDDGIYMLQGYGGNIGVSVGDDGVFMIDDQYSPLTPKILAAIDEISIKPVKFLINTHWHGDHTGGNENLGKLGVVIVAHDNVYKRLSTDQVIKAFNRTVPASPKDALPALSFNDEMTFHINGTHIKARHYANAHTDGDSILFFEDNNVVHMGDTFFNRLYPFIDSGAGGSIYGMISTAEDILKLVDDNTKIIPGHGPLATKKDLQDFRDMLVKVVDIVTPLTKKGLSFEDANKMNPLKDLNDVWGKGFLNPENFLRTVYQPITDHNK